MTSSGEHYESLKNLPIEEIRSKLRELLIEQHQGKWIYGGLPDDHEAEAKHDLFVQDRVALGIALTAIERGITASPTRKPTKSGRAAKESLVAAITEDILS